VSGAPVTLRKAALPIALLCAMAPRAHAQDSPSDSTAVAVADTAAAVPWIPATASGKPAKAPLIALEPEIAAHPYQVDPGPRPYQHRLSFSPGYGSFGSETMFTARIAYYPNTWLGYEGAISHTSGQSAHAVTNSLSLLLRAPFPGRFQPYAAGGYGMMLVFPGLAVNADPVTKNLLNIGGGLEVFIRNDLALRADVRHSTVFGSQRNMEGLVTYNYLQQTIALAFYRSVAP
jgi:hypothetical protein